MDRRSGRGSPSPTIPRDPRRSPFNWPPLTLIHHTTPRNPSRRLPIVPPAQKLCSTLAMPHRRAPTPANHCSSSAARPGFSPGPSSPTSARAAPELPRRTTAGEPRCRRPSAPRPRLILVLGEHSPTSSLSLALGYLARRSLQFWERRAPALHRHVRHGSAVAEPLQHGSTPREPRIDMPRHRARARTSSHPDSSLDSVRT